MSTKLAYVSSESDISRIFLREEHTSKDMRGCFELVMNTQKQEAADDRG